jgi:hypothetical protein
MKPKNNFTLSFLLSCLLIDYLFLFIYCFISVLLIRKLVLDNHTVELATQGNHFVLHVARKGQRSSERQIPESSI